MKNIAVITLLWLATLPAFSQSVSITKSGGWLETAWAKWTPLADAKSYEVTISGSGLINQTVDDQLIRSYGTYMRVDVPGLKAGTYTIQIVPILSDDAAGQAAVTPVITVKAHDRTGFAFSGNRVPGGYKADGTPKDQAVILYISENTKNTVSLDVTGANANPCVGLETIMEGFKKGKDNRPLIVRFIGQITDLSYMDKGDVVIENSNNTSSYITFEGIGDDAVIDGWGIRVKNASNIEIKNLGTMNCNSDEGDNIGLQQNNDHIWVHHCDFFYGDAGSDADQAKGDGALDCKKSTFVTFSYNHFWDSGKSNLLGLSEGSSDGLYITYHHNWYDHSDSRHPRVRFYNAHVYNNYYDGNSKYGVGATEGSSVLVEGNYFRNCKYPMLISMQGSDVYDESKQANDYTDMPTFSKEDGGIIKAWNNYMTGQRRFVAYGDAGYANSTVDFDAYVADSRSEQVGAGVKSYQGGNTFSNFDINANVMYAYTPESPEAAKATVMELAGRIGGGDFQWQFDNAVDDASYAVNAALKAALGSYKTKLISIQGDGAVSDGGGITGGGDDGGSGDNGGGTDGGTITADIVHNFTLDGKTSSFFSITGNLSDSKGTVTYAGLTLTQCLKMESATNVSFVLADTAELVLVFNESFTGKINIDGNSFNAAQGILEKTLAPGNHEITKGDVANLYLIGLKLEDTSSGGTDDGSGDDGTDDGSGDDGTDDGSGDDGSDDESTTILANSPQEEGFVIYPNPASDWLYWKGTQQLQSLSLYGMNGELLMQIKDSERSIDLRALSQGTYVLIIQTDKELSQRLLIKK